MSTMTESQKHAENYRMIKMPEENKASFVSSTNDLYEDGKIALETVKQNLKSADFS